jgi:hypothetical protein
MSLSPISVLLWGSLSIKKACRRPYNQDILQPHGQPGGRLGTDGRQGEGAGGQDEMFVLYRNSALRTHVPNITVFAHQELRMEVASGKRLEETINTTRLESRMSFLQIRVSMSLQDKICQVCQEICQSRRSSWRSSPEQTTLTACCRFSGEVT